MNKILPFFAFLLLTGTAAIAQKNESVLWKITGNGLPKASYLLGTMHAASKTLLDSFPAVMQLASTADFGIFESGGTKLADEIPSDIDSPPLDSVFTPEEYALVDSFFTASTYGSIRPHNNDASLLGMVQFVLLVNTQTKDTLFDDFIHFKMEDMKKPTFQLDEAAEMDGIEKELNSRLLAQFMIILIKKGYTARDKELTGDIDFNLYSKSLQNPMRLDEKVNDELHNVTVKRNAMWIPKIEQKLREGSCFIAVGLGHLQYQTGLIQLLRNKGYTLEPVALQRR